MGSKSYLDDLHKKNREDFAEIIERTTKSMSCENIDSDFSLISDSVKNKNLRRSMNDWEENVQTKRFKFAPPTTKKGSQTSVFNPHEGIDAEKTVGLKSNKIQHQKEKSIIKDAPCTQTSETLQLDSAPPTLQSNSYKGDTSFTFKKTQESRTSKNSADQILCDLSKQKQRLNNVVTHLEIHEALQPSSHIEETIFDSEESQEFNLKENVSEGSKSNHEYHVQQQKGKSSLDNSQTEAGTTLQSHLDYKDTNSNVQKEKQGVIPTKTVKISFDDKTTAGANLGKMFFNINLEFLYSLYLLQTYFIFFSISTFFFIFNSILFY